jgi:hypothetical protein
MMNEINAPPLKPKTKKDHSLSRSVRKASLEPSLLAALE